ncbi:MAG: response regulator [Proteobacteria bacterium]|nr:response regulator [Pseudomonadota bacterium]MBU1420424.1 response regulator [Pseudomonadota bacterium]MBU1456373.1 response regulator [Pseudomonadota bacterium]
MDKPEILIIDDDPAQHEILGEHLRLAGFSPLHAASSDEGIALLQNKEVSLILLDINMPKVDGFQTIKLLRHQPRTAEIPVLFLTSLDRQYLKIKGLELGADDYVTKPYNSAELIARIKAILRRSKHTVVQESELSGDVKAIGLVDLLQNLGQSSRTARIKLPAMDGEIIVSGEEVVLVRQGRHEGMEALLRLLLMERGRFEVFYQEIPGLATGQGIPIIKALLNVANQVDSIRMAVEKTGQTDPFLEFVDKGGSGNSAIDALQASFPVRFFTLVAAMEEPIEKNVDKVLQAISDNRIYCQDE